MKRYTLEVTIDEASDEFWESLGDKSGGDEVAYVVSKILDEAGFSPENCLVSLVKFERI